MIVSISQIGTGNWFKGGIEFSVIFMLTLYSLDLIK